MPFRKPRHLTWREFGRRLWVELQEDAVTECAAQLAFYFLFALFPFLFFLVTLAAYLPFAPGAVDAMLERLGPLMPAEAWQRGAGTTSSRSSRTASPASITLGLLVALWTASRGVDAFRRALNLAYDVPEYRPLWKTQGLAILMTVAGSLLIPLAFALFLLGGQVGEWIAGRLHFLNVYQAVWSWLRWPFTACARHAGAGAVLLAPARRPAPLQLPLPRRGARHPAVAAHHLGLHPVRRALRPLQRHLWLHRRRRRAAAVALPHRPHLHPRRRGECRPRARRGRGGPGRRKASAHRGPLTSSGAPGASARAESGSPSGAGAGAWPSAPPTRSFPPPRSRTPPARARARRSRDRTPPLH